MERTLASIQRIVKIEPIPNADKIEVATVLGWECVVPKGQFKVGDLVVYFEIDSLIPYTEWSKFLWKDKVPEDIAEARYRLRTVKLRGQVSQGLVQPLNILNYAEAKNGTGRYYDTKESDDVSGILGIIKFEPPVSATLRGNCKVRRPSWIRKYLYRYFPFLFRHKPTSSTFPEFIPKTDEIRVQSIPKIFDEIKGLPVYITEKIDGTSATYYLKGKEFGVCSRNIELEESKDNTYWKIAREYDIKNKLKQYLKETGYKGVAIQGEIVGEGIQKNPLKLKGQKFFLFNLYHINTRRYAGFKDFIFFSRKYNIPTVPILEAEIRVPDSWDIKTLVEMAKGNSVLTPTVKREGIIIRTTSDIYSRVLRGRTSFKAINNEYLIERGE